MRKLDSIQDLWRRVQNYEDQLIVALESLEQTLCLELCLEPPPPGEIQKGILHKHAIDSRRQGKPGGAHHRIR